MFCTYSSTDAFEPGIRTCAPVYGLGRAKKFQQYNFSLCGPRISKRFNLKQILGGRRIALDTAKKSEVWPNGNHAGTQKFRAATKSKRTCKRRWSALAFRSESA